MRRLRAGGWLRWETRGKSCASLEKALWIPFRRRRACSPGIHILHPRLLRQVPKGEASSIIDPYVRAIEQGEPVLGYDLRGYWSDVGTAERYAQAERDVRAGLIRLEDRQPLEPRGPLK